MHDITGTAPPKPPTASPRDYINEAYAVNTRRAYRNDIDHFKAWGGTLPATAETVVQYLSDHAGVLSISTLKRRLATLSKAHKLLNLSSPVQAEIVRMTLRGIQRTHGTSITQATPLTRDDLISLLSGIPETPKGIRDRAILLTGFAGALRRSEIVGLNIEDVIADRHGLILHIRRSKTDQSGQGRKIPVPYGRGKICPVKALKDWITILNNDQGPLFLPIRKGGTVEEMRLSDRAISDIIKSHVRATGMDEQLYSGHSLRSGFCTTAAQMNIPEWKIMRQTGHKSHQTLLRYIRDARLFEDSAGLDMF